MFINLFLFKLNAKRLTSNKLLTELAFSLNVENTLIETAYDDILFKYT